MPRQDDLNEVFTDELTGIKGRLEMVTDALNALDRAVGQTLERLAATGADYAATLGEYRQAMAVLRRAGFRDRGVEAAATACPQCRAQIRVAGEKGDRCDWCGYVFALKCPSCRRELKNVEGNPGDRCAWCQYEFE